MCDLLCLMPDAVPSGDIGPGTWRPGMVVSVHEDGRLGPGLEQHPRFLVIHIPGADPEELAQWTEADATESEPFPYGVGDDPPRSRVTLINRRILALDFATISAARLNTIETRRETTFTDAAEFMAHKRDV